MDLVIQIGATRSIATFLQRVGRSGHAVRRIPKGRLFPLTIDELDALVDGFLAAAAPHQAVIRNSENHLGAARRDQMATAQVLANAKRFGRATVSPAAPETQ